MWPFKKKERFEPMSDYDPRRDMLGSILGNLIPAFQVSPASDGYLVQIYRPNTHNEVCFCKNIMEVNELLVRETAKQKIGAIPNYPTTGAVTSKY